VKGARRGKRRTLPLGWWALLLVGLAMVPWRQTQGVRLERELRTHREDRASAEAERLEWMQRAQRLKARGRILELARTRLGMHLPGDDEVLLLPLAPPAPAP
jgi:cell division protein FtsL